VKEKGRDPAEFREKKGRKEERKICGVSTDDHTGNGKPTLCAFERKESRVLYCRSLGKRKGKKKENNGVERDEMTPEQTSFNLIATRKRNLLLAESTVERKERLPGWQTLLGNSLPPHRGRGLVPF